MLHSYAFSEDKGFRLPEELISDSYFLMNKPLTENVLFKYITTVNINLSPSDAHELAHTLLSVANCFQIDPWILTGLVQQESWFNKDAVSKTGASGLTQFTNIGIKEVHDQLGQRGIIGAPESSINYFNSVLYECVNQNWVQLWEKVDVSPDHPEYYLKLKGMLKLDIVASLVYGAILLKTFVTYEQLKNIKQEKNLQTSEIYFYALQRYNGEPGDAKIRYAKKIFSYLKLLYSGPIEFPFPTDTLFD